MLLLLAFLTLAACASSPASTSHLDRVPNGEWGGKGVRMTVEDSGATVEFDCAHGSLVEPLRLEGDGRFDVEGSLVAEGGPDRIDDAERGRPARYRGEIEGERMRLEVTLEAGESFGTFWLRKGAEAKLFKCL